VPAGETHTAPQNEPEQAHEQMYAITFEITGNKLQMVELNDAMNSIGIKFNVLNRKKVD
jgi:penicillin V acylase-like amidase (Ntn superfamily)